MISRACVFAAALALGAEPTSARAQEPCRAEVEQQLRAWRHQPPPRPQPPATDGATVRHWPTDELGTWVVQRSGGANASLTRVGPDATLEIAWTAACRPQETRRARPPIDAPRFSDGDLRRLLDTTAAGLIYVWSPHMPLSADGVAAVRTAAQARALPVTVLLDPGSNRAFAAQVAGERGLPPEVLRAADSVELTFRDVLVHAPTVQVYRQGRLRGSPYPGYHTADEYGAYIDRVLGAGRDGADTARQRGILAASR
jgi:hypothetical protein